MPMFSTVCTVLYNLKVGAGRKIAFVGASSRADANQTDCKYSFFTVRNLAAPKFQVQGNRETGHFSDSGGSIPDHLEIGTVT